MNKQQQQQQQQQQEQEQQEQQEQTLRLKNNSQNNKNSRFRFTMPHATSRFTYLMRFFTSLLSARVFFSAAADISKAGSGAFEQVKLQLFLAFRMFLE